MIELVLFVCLVSSPTECRQEHVAFDGPMMACALHGQQAAATWLSTHPKWRLNKWRCGPPEMAT